MKTLKWLLLFPVALFSFQVEFEKKFTQEFPHDVLIAHLSISIEDETESKVNKRLEAFNTKIKSYDKVEKKLGVFDIRPKFRHSSNTPRVSGYIGVLRYKVSSNKALFMNELIREISEMKKNRDTAISLNELKWGITNESYSIGFDLLRLDAILWIENHLKSLSHDINRDCIIKNINIKNISKPISVRAALVNGSDTNDVTVPKYDKEVLVISSKYTLECK